MLFIKLLKSPPPSDVAILRGVAEAERAVVKAQRFLQLRDRAQAKINRIDKIQRVLTGFANEMTQSRIREISARATDMHHQLARKEGGIGQIQMDAKTLQIRLLDRDGNGDSYELTPPSAKTPRSIASRGKRAPGVRKAVVERGKKSAKRVSRAR